MQQVVQLDENEYDLFEKKAQLGTYMQTVEQAHELKARGVQTAYLGLKNDDNQLIAGALVSWRKLRLGSAFEVVGGPLMDYDNEQVVTAMMNGLKQFAHDHGGLTLHVQPTLAVHELDNDGQVQATQNQTAIQNLKQAGFKHTPTVAGYSTATLGYEFVKPLTGVSVATVFSTYEKDAQYALKKTQQFGVRLREIDYDELPLFHQYTSETAQRLNFEDKPLDYYQKTYRAYGDDVKFIFAEIDFDAYIQSQTDRIDELTGLLNELDKKIAEKSNKHLKARQHEYLDQVNQHKKRIHDAETFKAEYGNVAVLSGAMFFIEPQEIGYMFSFTNDQFKKFYAPYMIQDHMIRLAIKLNIPLYNFYGVSGNFDGSDGVLMFKQGFGGVTRENIGVFDYSVRPVVERAYTLIKRLLGK
ncbi:peptidoglycan bridge formation glycyltransferase FemA/FemB family protein [Furfurilactobacillus sp. WILCCON 0119]